MTARKQSLFVTGIGACVVGTEQFLKQMVSEEVEGGFILVDCVFRFMYHGHTHYLVRALVWRVGFPGTLLVHRAKVYHTARSVISNSLAGRMEGGMVLFEIEGYG